MKLTSKVFLDDAVKNASEAFDFPFDGTTVTHLPDASELPPRDGSWALGVVVGPSGAGKSTLARAAYGFSPTPAWVSDRAVVSQVPRHRLSALGLNSIPSWCRPRHLLSTGEGYRADLAAILSSNICVDEFTSVLDRIVAKTVSASLAKAVRGERMVGVVLVTCHYDVLDWLAPDWVYELPKGHLTWPERGRRRPSIELCIHEVRGKEYWPLFSPHHYLTHELHKAARSWVAFWGDVPVAFASALPMPSGSVRNAWRGHRLVVLPEFQGLGLGPRVSDAIGEAMKRQGYRFFSKTAHPRLGAYRNASTLWRPTQKNGKARRVSGANRSLPNFNAAVRVGKVCFSHEYIGYTA